VGRAKLAVPRCPPLECTGDRRRWLVIDARALRGWAMTPMALAVRMDIGGITNEESMGVFRAGTGLDARESRG